MKINLNYFFLFFAIIAFASGCGEDEYETIDGEYGTSTATVVDPLLNVNSQVLSFQAGTASYPLSFDLVNGSAALTTINVYSVFTDASSGVTSNEVLFKSYPVAAGTRVNFNDDITYDQLRDGISLAGAALPDDQVSVAIGSGWLMRFEGIGAGGAVVPLSGNVRVAVLSRFAGIYKVIESAYFRIGSDSGPWNDSEIFIGSVDETTFSHNDMWGPFGWVGSSFTFSIDEATNLITVPLLDADGQLANGNALFSGNRAVGCHTEEGFFENVPCTDSNVLIPDDANGKHIIRLTYGYFTDGSGAREFYEVLEKQ